MRIPAHRGLSYSKNEKGAAWIPVQLYRTGMFRGSLMQGAKSVARGT
jgi:hypothetical protein